MRRDSILDPVALLPLLVVGMAVTACGGSASETPFPQPPIERELAARHERASGDASADTETSASSAATSAALSTQPNTAEAPVVAPTAEPEAPPAPAF